jgi:hypothetical protein
VLPLFILDDDKMDEALAVRASAPAQMKPVRSADGKKAPDRLAELGAE